MRIVKKILSMFIIAVFLGSNVKGFALATAVATTKVASTQDLNQTEALSRIEALGIMDELTNETDDTNKTMRRDEFAKSIVIASGLQNLADSLKYQSVFADVKTSNKMVGYINVAISKGFLTGAADGKFHPEQNLTYAQICTAVVKALGYNDSDLSGVWPNNYIEKASILELLDGISLKSSDGVPRWAAAVIMDRLLNTNIKKNNPQDADKTFINSVGAYTDLIILGNSLTDSSLDVNQVLTSKGIYNLLDNSKDLQLGYEYRVLVNKNKISKIYYSLKAVKQINVKSLSNNILSYDENNSSKTMTLPDTITYYNDGAKQNFDNLKNIIQGDSIIVFAYNDDNTGYDYATIIDPKYSKAEIASNVKPGDKNIGNISISDNEPIIKNGEYISISAIQNDDVVYEVSDVNGLRKYICVLDNKIEGKLTGILPNRLYPKTIQVDNKNYDISKDMDLTKLTKSDSAYNIGDVIQIFIGYDNTVVDVSKTSIVGTNEDCIILGNSNTLNSLEDNQVLTDKGIFYLANNNIKLNLGSKYTLYIDGDKIEKSQAAINQVQSIVVKNVRGSEIVYVNGGKETSMTLPDKVSYYYQGVKQNYASIGNLIQGDSTIIFANNTDNVGYDYALIIDPVYSKAEVAANVKVGDTSIGKINLSPNELIVKNGGYINISDIRDGDVVYQVSDIANTNQYIYAMDSKIEGKLTGVLPNRLYPKTIQIDNKNYPISMDMDITKLTSKDSIYNIGDTVQILSGYDASIVDISKTIIIGTNTDCIILGNSKTSSNLADNQILTDKGIYYLTDSDINLSVGSKYTLYIKNDIVISASAAINEVRNIIVNNVRSTGITYTDSGKQIQMVLPDKVSYYYQGTKQNYSNLINLLKVDSTIIFAYNTDGVGYEYADILDPVYSKPVIANNVRIGDKNIGSIDLTNWGSVVKDGEYINPYNILNGDVVYQVSDVKHTNSYILALDTRVTGVITGILPNRINPTTIQIDNKNYDLSNDFNFSKLTDKSSPYKINDTVQISMGYDGKVVNLDYLEGQDNANVAYVLNTSTVTVNGNPIYYAKILKSDGTIATYKSYLDATNLKGCLVTFTNIDDTTLLLNVILNQSYPQMSINKDDMKIGNSYAADNIRIFDVISNVAGADAVVKVLNFNDLYSGVLYAGQISYMNPVGAFGDINIMVLNDVFNEGFSYGLVKSATATVTGQGNRKTTTYNYTISVNGKDYQLNTTNAYGISTMDIVNVSISGGQIASIGGVVAVEGEGTSIQALDAKKIKFNNNIYKFRSDLQVYYLSTSGAFNTKAISDVDITQTYTKVDIYLDKALSDGGKVRMIVITQ